MKVGGLGIIWFQVVRSSGLCRRGIGGASGEPCIGRGGFFVFLSHYVLSSARGRFLVGPYTPGSVQGWGRRPYNQVNRDRLELGCRVYLGSCVLTPAGGISF